MTDTDPLRRLLRAAGPRPPVPEERARRVREAAREEWRAAVAARRAQTRLRSRRRLALAAAAVALAACALWVLRDRPGAPVAVASAATVERVAGDAAATTAAGATPLVEGETLAGPRELRTAAGAVAGLGLAAGHSVRLDGSTRLEWVGEHRLRLHAGAIYVDSRGAAASLVVETPHGSVAELGTRYEVRLSATDDTVSVGLREGAVRWTSPAGESREVAAGRRIVVSADGVVAERRIAPDDDAWRWVVAAGPRFVLDGSTLADFLDWAAREHGLRFTYRDSAMRAEAESIELAGGTVDGLPPEQALALVMAVSGWEWSDADGVYALRRAGG